jgi:tRNA nucleotidyltransferase/poly(A) polymerase
VYNNASSLKNHRLYPEFKKVARRLAEHQFVCWIAGGAVRDLILGAEVSDFDLVTDASTEVLKHLFPEAVLVGEAFGVLKIPIGPDLKEFLDLSTFREESEYQDGRRPSQVKASTPVQDSLRRDFTVNAIYWDDVSEVVWDYQGGLFDLKQKKLKCVGDAKIRFSEDYLRIVRLMRFSLQLGFVIEPTTLNAARDELRNIQKVSGERIWAEFRKIEKAQAWSKAWSSQFFKEIFSLVLDDSTLLESSKLKIQSSMKLEMVLFLVNPRRDYSPILKSRFRVSNKEVDCYRNIRFLNENVLKLSLEELAFELEKSETLFFQFREMISAALFESVLLTKVDALLNENPETLVTASEIKDLIPARQISSEIRLIRVGQLGKIYRSRDDVFEYLKKKYA